MTARTAGDLHDDVNIVVLTVVFIMAVLSLWDGPSSVGHTWVIVVMTVYLLIDMAWIAARPAIAKTPVSVIIHHVVTLIVISGAVEHADHRVNASRALLVEINTVLITLRRKLGRPLWCEVGFFGTWIVLRLVWFPMLGAAMLASTFGLKDGYARVPPLLQVHIVTPPGIKAYASVGFALVVALQFYWTFSLAGSVLGGGNNKSDKSDAIAKKTDGDAEKKDTRSKSLFLPTAALVLPTLVLLGSAVNRANNE